MPLCCAPVVFISYWSICGGSHAHSSESSTGKAPGSLYICAVRDDLLQVLDFLYANSGWQFGDVARAVNKGVGRLMELTGKDNSPSNMPLAAWLQQEYNWIGFVAVSDPGAGNALLAALPWN